MDIQEGNLFFLPSKVFSLPETHFPWIKLMPPIPNVLKVRIAQKEEALPNPKDY